MIKQNYKRADGMIEVHQFNDLDAKRIWENNNKDRLENGIYSKDYARPTKSYYINYEELKKKVLERIEYLKINKLETNKYKSDIATYCKCNIADAIICLLEIYEN